MAQKIVKFQFTGLGFLSEEESQLYLKNHIYPKNNTPQHLNVLIQAKEVLHLLLREKTVTGTESPAMFPAALDSSLGLLSNKKTSLKTSYLKRSHKRGYQHCSQTQSPKILP